MAPGTKWPTLAGLVPICPRVHFSRFDPKSLTLAASTPPRSSSREQGRARVGGKMKSVYCLQSVVSHYHTHSYQTEHTVPSPVDELRGRGPTVGCRPAGWCTPRMHTTSAVRVQRYPLVLAAIPCCRRSPRVSPPPSPPAHAAPVVHVLRFPMPRLNLLAPAVMRTRAAHAHRPRSSGTTAAARP